MGFESRAISARVTKQIVTIFSKTCDKCNQIQPNYSHFQSPNYNASLKLRSTFIRNFVRIFYHYAFSKYRY